MEEQNGQPTEEHDAEQQDSQRATGSGETMTEEQQKHYIKFLWGWRLEFSY